MCVLQFPLDATRNNRPPVGKGGNITDYHVRLLDQQKIPRICLTVDVPLNLANLLEAEPNLAPRRADGYKILAPLGGFGCMIRQIRLLQVTRIDYDQPIDPSVFTLQIPEDVNWYEPPERLPDNEKYERMTPRQAARAFFEACAKEDWDEARKFWSSSIDDRMKKYLGGLEILQIGAAFQSKGYPGWFVPYEIRLKSGGHVKKHNLALRHCQAKRFIVDGGI